MAIDDVMETCADTAVWSNVIANDIYGESTEWKLTVLVTDGEYGSCVISGKKKWGVWFEKTRWFRVFGLLLFTIYTIHTNNLYETISSCLHPKMARMVNVTRKLCTLRLLDLLGLTSANTRHVPFIQTSQAGGQKLTRRSVLRPPSRSVSLNVCAL